MSLTWREASTLVMSVPESPVPASLEERYCIACGYRLDTSPHHRCSECGQTFDPKNPATYAIRLIGASSRTFVWRGLMSGAVSTFIGVLAVMEVPWGLGWWLLVALVPGASFAFAVVVPLARRADATLREQVIVFSLVAIGCPAALFVVEQSSVFCLGSLVGGGMVAAAASWFLNHTVRIGILWTTIGVAFAMGAAIDLADLVGLGNSFGLVIAVAFLVGWQPTIAACLSLGQRSLTAADDPSLRLTPANLVNQPDADTAES